MEKKTAKKDAHPSEAEQKLYELSVHIDPTEGEEKAGEVFSELEARVKKEGSIVRSESPIHIALAYPIAKRGRGKKMWLDTSYFASIAFEASPEGVATLKLELDQSIGVFRFLLVSLTPEEFSETQKRKAEHKVLQQEKEGGEGTPAPSQGIQEAELDKKIEELVV